MLQMAADMVDLNLTLRSPQSHLFESGENVATEYEYMVSSSMSYHFHSALVKQL